MEKGPNLIPIFKKRSSVPKPSNTVKPINIVETANETVKETSEESFDAITGVSNLRMEELGGVRFDESLPAPFKGTSTVDTKVYTKKDIFGSLRNNYPFADLEKQPTDSYKSSGGSIQYNGKFKGNSIQFTPNSHKDVNVLDDSSFRFVIHFVDDDGEVNSKWTSDKFKRELDAYSQSTNPYVNIDTVTIMQLPLSLIGNYAKSPKFSIPEDYAQVEISDTITTIEDVLRYIDYLVDNTSTEIQIIDAQELSTMDVDTYDEISAGILDNSININDKLGFPLQDDIDAQIESGEANDTPIVTNTPIQTETNKSVTEAPRTTVISPPPTIVDDNDDDSIGRRGLFGRKERRV